MWDLIHRSVELVPCFGVLSLIKFAGRYHRCLNSFSCYSRYSSSLHIDVPRATHWTNKIFGTASASLRAVSVQVAHLTCCSLDADLDPTLRMYSIQIRVPRLFSILRCMHWIIRLELNRRRNCWLGSIFLVVRIFSVEVLDGLIAHAPALISVERCIRTIVEHFTGFLLRTAQESTSWFKPTILVLFVIATEIDLGLDELRGIGNAEACCRIEITLVEHICRREILR